MLRYIFKNLKTISTNDWQYILPISINIIIYFLTDIIKLINKYDFAYSSSQISIEPYRIISYHFIHGDFNHLLANCIGIVIARYFFISLKSRDNILFILLILFLIPLQYYLYNIININLLYNKDSIAFGFSGVLYGINGFLLCCSIFGKKTFLFRDIRIKRNQISAKSLSIIMFIGLIYSLLPRVSLIGHVTGLTAGIIIYLL